MFLLISVLFRPLIMRPRTFVLAARNDVVKFKEKSQENVMPNSSVLSSFRCISDRIMVIMDSANNNQNMNFKKGSYYEMKMLASIHAQAYSSSPAGSPWKLELERTKVTF